VSTITRELPFTQIPDWVITHPDLSHATVRVYAAICTHASKERIAFPGIRRIAEEAHCSTSTVQHAIDELEAAGALQVTRRKDEVNHYHLPYRPSTHPVAMTDTPPVAMTDTELYPVLTTPTQQDKIAPAHTQMKNAIVEAMGWNPDEVSQPMWGQIEAAAKALRDLGVDPSTGEVARRARIYLVNQPGKLGPMALVKWWSDCAQPKVKPDARDVRAELRRQQMEDAMRSIR
jgi:hypothetical protein